MPDPTLEQRAALDAILSALAPLCEAARARVLAAAYACLRLKGPRPVQPKTSPLTTLEEPP